MTARQAINLINNTNDPTVLFGKIGYKQLALLVHPDRITDPSLKTQGQVAFQKLSEMFALFNGKTPAWPASKIGAWVVSQPLAKGDLCDLYRAESKNVTEAVFKLARSEKDNDLMDAEVAAIKHIKKHREDSHFLYYLPVLHDSLKASRRRANVFSLAQGYHNLADILAQQPDGGLDFRHVVWMMNRLLSVLGFIQRAGVVHGAVIPEHLLFHGKTHHLILVDWCYSVLTGTPLKAIARDRKAFYPKEVFNKQSVGAGLDIYMAVQTMTYAAKEIPREFAGIFEWSMAESPRARPQDLWALQDKWMAAAEKVYGPPKYVPLELTATN